MMDRESQKKQFHTCLRDFIGMKKARSRETGGTGLGLAISLKLARLLGGDLIGGNHPQGGAVFKLILPGNTNLS
jgi:signal transduction histidine kinase